jgi:hypothetical protein
VLQRFFAGQLNSKEIIKFGEPQAVLKAVGIPNFEMIAKQDVLNKVTWKHSVSRQTLEDLPQFISKSNNDI